MKNTLLIGALLLMIGQANAEAGVLDEALTTALEEASIDQIKAYTACLIEAEANQEDAEVCVNEELGDIHN